ncbi:glycoside hydrolase family 45 protein [Pyrenophora teres f. maculata]|nr:glycoside hydrolase family 45 protein [Pyrenophora teres f. maculata]
MLFFFTVFIPTLFTGAYGIGSAIQGTGTTTRQWSCCKNSCSWPGKALVDKPVLTCDASDNLLDNYNRRDGCDSGGGSFECSDLSPWAASNDLAYGFAAVNLAASNESAWCCSCYSLTFTSGPVNGKKMVVQVTSTGDDLGDDQFNIAIPGGGQGSTKGCSKQYASQDIWGQDYGGVAHRDDCDALPTNLQAGCYWRFDWFRGADNPSITWEKTKCPDSLSSVSGCRRNDDPLPGKNTPTPTPTTSAPLSSGTVQPGGQCGGKSYKGPTRCVGGTVCTYVDENSYYCLADPASTRTTPTTTTTAASAAPTIGLPYDQCGGNGWTGPTKCKDSVCVRVDECKYSCSVRVLPMSTSLRNSEILHHLATTKHTQANFLYSSCVTHAHETHNYDEAFCACSYRSSSVVRSMWWTNMAGINDVQSGLVMCQG